MAYQDIGRDNPVSKQEDGRITRADQDRSKGSLRPSLSDQAKRSRVIVMRTIAGGLALAVVASVIAQLRSDSVDPYLTSTSYSQSQLNDSQSSILSAEINLPGVKEEDKYAGWKTFIGPNFTLRYPNQPGWEKTTENGITLIELSGNMPVLIHTWVDPLINTTFDYHVEDQYGMAFPPGKNPNDGKKENLTNGNLSLVASPPVNLPGLREAGLQGAVLVRRKKPGSNISAYLESHFMFKANARVINLVVNERPSNIADYSGIVSLILESIKFYDIPGIQK